MDVNRLTQRSREALTAARDLAVAGHHQYVEPEHLLSALLSRDDGIIFPLLTRMGIDPTALRRTVSDALAGLPRVYGDTEVAFSPALAALLDTADDERRW